VWHQGLVKINFNSRAPQFKIGGGYQNQQFTFQIPADMPGCTAKGDCVLQMYAHSVEPRTYAICTDIIFSGAPTAVKAKRDVNGNVASAKSQTPILYQDSFDTSHVDSTHSGYRGQQGEFIRDELKASIQLQSFVGNAGLVPLGDIDKAKKCERLFKLKS
jgi:hypothetical protein